MYSLSFLPLMVLLLKHRTKKFFPYSLHFQKWTLRISILGTDFKVAKIKIYWQDYIPQLPISTIQYRQESCPCYFPLQGDISDSNQLSFASFEMAQRHPLKKILPLSHLSIFHTAFFWFPIFQFSLVTKNDVYTSI